MKKIKVNDLYYIIQHESNQDFDEIREQCLNDTDNRLWSNYTEQSLNIDHQDVFLSLHSFVNDECIAFSGLFNGDRYPNEVARMANRAYVFKKFRSYRNTINKPWHFGILIPTQIKLNPKNRKLVFISLQERIRQNKTVSNWLANNLPDDWTFVNDLIRTSPGSDSPCFQKIGYKLLTNDYTLNDWNPDKFNEKEWKDKFLK